MTLALFFHLYQPPTQFEEVTRKITESCYLKIVALLKKYPSAKITLNINASLTEQLDRLGYRRLLLSIANLVKKGQIELTGSAAYHPLLPKIPKGEIRRQIRLNDEINSHCFGGAWRPRGFFPPEMAYAPWLTPVLEDLGFEWVILDESAKIKDQSAKPKFKVQSSGLRIFFRNNKLSLGVAFGQISSVADLLGAINHQPSATGYHILAMDGETFGHHRPEQLKLLGELFNFQIPSLKLVTVSELCDQGYGEVEVAPLESSWGPKTRWDNPENPVHRLQWELTSLAIDAVNSSKLKAQSAKPGLKLKTKSSPRLLARSLLDRALHSDQYFWAAADPCWHPAMVERGARMLADTVLAVPDALAQDRKRAQALYQDILETGKRLHGEKAVIC